MLSIFQRILLILNRVASDDKCWGCAQLVIVNTRQRVRGLLEVLADDLVDDGLGGAPGAVGRS
jgi:hypothetical protein